LKITVVLDLSTGLWDQLTINRITVSSFVTHSFGDDFYEMFTVYEQFHRQQTEYNLEHSLNGFGKSEWTFSKFVEIFYCKKLTNSLQFVQLFVLLTGT